MQLLLLLLLGVMSAGALPQLQTLPLSEALAPTAMAASTNSPATPHTLEKREGGPTIGNFNNPKCQGEHTGIKTKIREKCFPFTPTDEYVDIYRGDGDGSVAFYSDENCVIKTHGLIAGSRSRTCVPVTSLNGTVRSMNVPNYM